MNIEGKVLQNIENKYASKEECEREKLECEEGVMPTIEWSNYTKKDSIIEEFKEKNYSLIPANYIIWGFPNFSNDQHKIFLKYGDRFQIIRNFF